MFNYNYTRDQDYKDVDYTCKKVEKIWTNNLGERENQRRLGQSLQDYYWRGSTTVRELL